MVKKFRLPRKNKKVFKRALKEVKVECNKMFWDDFIFGYSGCHINSVTKKIKRIHPIELDKMIHKQNITNL